MKEGYREIKDITDVLATPCILGFDSETQGLDWTAGQSSVFISYSISDSAGDAYQIFFHEECEAPGDFSIEWYRQSWIQERWDFEPVYIRRSDNFDEKLKQFRYLLEDPDIKLICHHGTYELHWLRRLFLNAQQDPPVVRGYVMDTQVAAQLVNPYKYKQTSLKKLWEGLTGNVGDWKDEHKGSMADVLAWDRDELITYACHDADKTRQLGVILRDELKKDRRLSRYFTRFCQPITSELLFLLEENGVKVDMTVLPEVKQELAEVITKTHDEAIKMIPEWVLDQHDEKVLSRRELVADALYLGFNCPVINVTDKGTRKTDKATRKAIERDSKTSKKALTFIKTYDEWNETQGFYVRYIKAFEEFLRYDRRLHTSYSIASAASGRVSSRDPMLMNIPKRSALAHNVRRLIIPEEGYKLVAFDVSQSELRWLAHISLDDELVRVFTSDEDIHLNTARSLTTDPWDQLSKDEQKANRTKAKAMNFGLIYGMQARSFVRYALDNYGLRITLKQANKWVETFFKTYPGIARYHEAVTSFLRKYGYAVSPFGRKRYFPKIKSTSEYVRGEAIRAAINHPIQSVSSDSFLLAWHTLMELPEAKAIRPIMFIHDEMVLELKDDSTLDELKNTIKYHLEHPPIAAVFGFEPRVPFKVDATEGYNLAAMSEV